MNATKSDKAFTLFLVAFALGFFCLSLDLSRHARFVPLCVLAVALPLLLLQVAMDWAPRLAGRLRLNEPRDIFSTDRFRQKTPAALTIARATGVFPAAHVIAWVLALPVLAALFGMPVAIPLHAFGFLVVRFRVSILTALLVAAVLGGLTVGALHILGGAQ